MSILAGFEITVITAMFILLDRAIGSTLQALHRYIERDVEDGSE